MAPALGFCLSFRYRFCHCFRLSLRLPLPLPLALPLALLLCLLCLPAPAEDQRDDWLRQVASAVEAEDVAQATTLVAQWQGEDDAQTLLWQGQVWALAEDWPAAARAFRGALDKQADSRYAAEGLIHVLLQQEDYPALRRFIGPWLELSDSPVAWWRAAAYAHLEAEDLLLAESVIVRALARHPEDWPLRRLWAQVLHQRQEHARAAALWRQIVSSNAGTDAASQAQDWYQLAAVEQAQDRPQESRRALLVAHGLDPQHGRIADGLLGSLLAQEHYHAAWDLAQALLADHDPAAPPAPQRLLLAAQAAEAQGEVAQGRAWLQLVPEADRDRSWALSEARLAVLDAEPAAALAQLEALLAQGSADAPALRLWAARVAWEAGKLAPAEAHLRAIAQGDEAGAPQRQQAQLALIRLLLNQDRIAEAQELSAEALAEDPYDRHLRRLSFLVEGMAADAAADDTHAPAD